MKSKPSPANLLKVLLSVAAGVAIGWWGKGMVTGRGTGPQGTVVPVAEISRTGSSSAPIPTPQNPTGVNAEESKAIAKRLLKEVMDNSRDKGRDKLLKARFPSALAGCDEAAVAEMIETLIRYGLDQGAPGDDDSTLLAQCRGMLATRMAAVNPWKALQYLARFKQYGLSCPPSAFLPALEPLSEPFLVQAQAVIERLPRGETRTVAELAWLQASVKYDPDAVFQHFMNLDEHTRVQFQDYPDKIRNLCQQLARQDPEKALQVASSIPMNSFNDSRGDLLSEWFHRDSEAAGQWVLKQNDAEFFNLSLTRMGMDFRGLDEKSLRDNFHTIKSNDPTARADLAKTLAASLANQDISESLRWVANMPTLEQNAANLAVAEVWIRNDTAAAAEWLATWPTGDSRDKAVVALLGEIVDEDPEAALSWAASIQSEYRYANMQQVMKIMTAKDPAAGERALQALSEEDRTVLSVLMRDHLQIK